MVAKKYKEQQSLYKYRPFPRRRLLFVSHMGVKDDCNFKFDRSDRSNLIDSFVFFLKYFLAFYGFIHKTSWRDDKKWGENDLPNLSVSI